MFWAICLSLFLIWIVTNKRGRKWIYIIQKTFHRDIKGAIIFGRVRYQLYLLAKNEETVPKLFTKTAKKYPNKVAFYFEDIRWTFQDLEDFSNKVANYFKYQGYRPGDSVALLLENRPDYVGLWLGLSKIGIVTALINTNLVSGSLMHSLIAANCKCVIYGSTFENVIQGVADKLTEIKLYRYKTTDTVKIMSNNVNLKSELDSASISSPTEDLVKTKTRDNAIYIYTSGTTGLPKAAKITHARFLFATVAFFYAVDLDSEDIFYNPLPLYHSSGGMVGVGQTLVFGVSNVLRKKFSASGFWTDCKKYNCTIANYIGEICRYLLATHNNNNNIEHNIKKMVGNGLRRDIWEKFQKTFRIPRIIEFYGATEGNANVVNIDNTPGAVGFLPPFASSFYPVCIIKCDENTKEPLRNEQGRCIRCKPNEPGILIGKINQKNAVNDFTGYADKTETSKKIIKDAFKNGELYFNSGDIVVKDELGYIYFMDRTGDTFRWKGENVATNEVESVITQLIGPKELVVYGVEIPNTEGKCGMVTILDPNRTVNIEDLCKSLKDHLPGYAIPLFLRLADSLPITGTFKVKKIDLQKEGFDLKKINDPLYFYDSKKTCYIPLKDVYDDIIHGTIKL